MLDSSSSPSESSPLGSSPPDAPRRADALSVSVPQPSLLAEPPSTGVLPASLPKVELPPQACPEQVPVATVSGARAMVDPATSSPVQAASRISLSGCGCGGGCNGAPQLVFALGSLGYDFGTQARYDAIGEVIGQQPEGTTNPLLLPVITTDQLLALLKTAGMAHFATSIIWTLNIEATPVYAIRPDGPFAHQTYQRLVEFLEDQVNPNVLSERLSVPGYVAGSVRLLSGQSVPVICPELRGMYNWKTADLVQLICGKAPTEKAQQGKKDEYEERAEGVGNFLQRVYFELRNLGQDPRDRALNFAATNAFNVEQVFRSSLQKNLELDDITVTPSPVCRQDSDCWDVVLTFFNPADLNVSRRAYRFTVDVSDVVPVLVGLVREWAVR
jgi:cyanobactin maturation PatA/PatG family protease